MPDLKYCCCCFELAFDEEGAEFELDFGEVQIIHTDYDPYGGPYEAIPKTYEQVLATNDKNMEDDVTVYEIPYAEVANEHGTTVNIAYL